MRDDMLELRERMGRLNLQMDAVLGCLQETKGILEIMRDQLDAVVDWANQPPSEDLPKALTVLAASVRDVQEGFIALRNDIPALVADGVREAAHR